MKNKIATIVFLIIIAFCGYLLFLNMNLRNEQAETNKKIGTLEQKINKMAPGKEPELAIHMQHLLTYADKLWFSGIAGNEELVHFYVHEIEENMEAIHDANMIYDSVRISPLMKQFGLRAVENFEGKIESGEEFESAYKILINQCNNCHNSAKHAYVKIKVPEKPAFDNQDYSKTE